MNLRRKISLFVAILVAAICFLPPKAYAAEGDPAESQSFWDKVKDAGSAAADYVGEHKDGWIESAKNGAHAAADKAGELYDAAKEAAPGVIDAAKDAHQQFVDWNNQQRDEVNAWAENQFNGGQSIPSSSSADGTDTGSNGSITGTTTPSGSTTGSATGDQATITAPSNSQQSNPPAATAPAEPPTDSNGAQTPSDAAQAPNLPGYEMSSDGRTVTIDGEEYMKLDDGDKLALKDGKLRQWLFLFVGVPILAILGIVWIVLEVRDAGKRRKRRR